MKPRLKSSKKWTAFPTEYADQIKAVFVENFSEKLIETNLKVEGRIFPEEITLRIALQFKKQLAGANFEVSTNYNPLEENDAVEKIHLCVDAAAAMMTEYYDNPDETDFPRTWKEVLFGKAKLYVQFSTENTDLEAEANRLLGLSEDSMLQEDDENDMDALAHAEIDEEISPARDDEDFSEEDQDEDSESDEGEDNQPRMFGGKKKPKKEDMH